MEVYNKNNVHIINEHQELIRQTPIIIAGCGLGGNIAECALRTGFETITLVDGCDVEMSNPNSDNFTVSEQKTKRVRTLAEQLNKINDKAKINVIPDLIDYNNLSNIVCGHSIAINCLTLNTDIPFQFDLCCGDNNIPVIHPFDFHSGAVITVVRPKGYQMTEISEELECFDLKVAEYVSKFGHFWNTPFEWLDKIIDSSIRAADGVPYTKLTADGVPYPKLSIGSWLAAGVAVQLMCRLATGSQINYFPKFYISSLDTDAQ